MGKDAEAFGNAKRASQLQLILAVLGVVTLGLLVGLIVVATKSTTNPDEGEGCTTESCLTLAAQLKTLANTELDPCDSFAQYACSGWISNQVALEKDIVISRFRDALPLLRKRSIRILEGPLENETLPAPRSLDLARGFYRSCLDAAQQETFGDGEIKRLLEEGLGETLTEANLGSAIHNMSVIFGAYPFLEFLTANYPGHPYVVLYVRPPEHNPDDVYTQEKRDAMRTYMNDVFGLLGINQNLAMPAEAIHAWIKDQRNQTSGDPTGQDVPRPRHFPLHNITTSLLTNLTENQKTVLSGSDDAVVDDMYHLLQVSNYLENLTRTSPDALLAYLKFKSVEQYLPYMGQAYRNAIQKHNVALGGQPGPKPSPLPGSPCSQLTYKLFRNVVELMYYRHYSEGPAAANEARTIFNHMKEDMKAVINELTYATAADKQLLVQKADKMVLAVGLANYFQSFTTIDSLYSDMGTNLTCFVCSFVQASRVLGRSKVTLIGQPPSTDPILNEESLAVNAYYDPPDNAAVCLLGILEEPIFTTTANYLYKYSRFGALFAHEIGHGFDISNFEFGLEGFLSDAFVAEYESRSDCVQNYYNMYKVHYLPVNGERTLDENIADIIGLGVSLRTYRRLYASSDSALPGMSGMTLDQQFFLSHAQSQCAKVNNATGVGRYNRIISVHAPDMVRIDGPFSQNKDFAAAYQCKPGTRMNPVKKCGLFF